MYSKYFIKKEFILKPFKIMGLNDLGPQIFLPWHGKNAVKGRNDKFTISVKHTEANNKLKN